MSTKSWGPGFAVVAAALLGPLTMLQEAAPAAAATEHQQAAQRTASVEPVELKAWLYPSKDPLSPTVWQCFGRADVSNSQFLCAQLGVPAPSLTPSGATGPAASPDPVHLQAWLYPSDKPLAPAAWECFSSADVSNSQFICAQLGVPAPSWTPSGS
jgi:hypothetical protein